MHRLAPASVALGGLLLAAACGEPEPATWTGTGSVDPGPDCGNGRLDAGEECDAGEENSDSAADACRSDCTEARCGDGTVDSAEACDDGATWGGDGCDPGCAAEPGQGEAEALGEASNDEPGTAEAWEGGSVHGALPEGDRDCFAVELDTCEAISATLTGTCEDPVRIGLFTPDGAEVAASRLGEDGCAVLDPAESQGARFVTETGTWAVCLAGSGGQEVRGYSLELAVSAPEAGLYPVDPDDDLDGDGLPTDCDEDRDGDGVLDDDDNCPDVPNGEADLSLAPEPDGWITTWLAAAPFAGEGSTESCKPVETPRVTEDDDALVVPSLGDAAGEQTWRALFSPSVRVDFNLDWGDIAAPREIYLAVHLRAAEAQTATFALGPDDGARAWLDQQWILETTACQGTVADRYTAEVQLTGDWQTLVFKVYDQGGGWGTYARFLDAEGEPLEDLELALVADGSSLESQQDTDGDGEGDLCDETPTGDGSAGDTGTPDTGAGDTGG